VRFYNERRIHQALDYRTPAELYFQYKKRSLPGEIFTVGKLKNKTPLIYLVLCLDKEVHHSSG
jgi:hypothetical protein